MEQYKFLFVLLCSVVIFSASVMAKDNMTIIVKPLIGNSLTNNTHFNYIYQFSEYSDCSSPSFSHTSNITTNSQGVGVVSINVSSISQSPKYVCEYRNSSLRAIFGVGVGIFDKVVFKNATLNWTNLVNVPSGFADNTDDNNWTTRTQVFSMTNVSKYFQIKTNWNNILSIPSGFNDNVDDDTWNTTLQIQNAINHSSQYNLKLNWSNLLNIPFGFSDGVDNSSTGISNGNTTLQIRTAVRNLFINTTDTNTWNTTLQMRNAVRNQFVNTTDTDTWNTTNQIRNSVRNMFLNTTDSDTWNTTLQIRIAARNLFTNTTDTWNNTLQIRTVVRNLFVNTTDTDTWNTSIQIRNAVNNTKPYNLKIDWGNLLNVPSGFSDGVDDNNWTTRTQTRLAVSNMFVNTTNNWTTTLQSRNAVRNMFFNTTDTNTWNTSSQMRAATTNSYLNKTSGGLIQGNINMTNKNITSVMCIQFQNGGKICQSN